MDLDLVQALHQTQRMLAEREDLDGRTRQLKATVDAVLARYQVTGGKGEVAYREQGADMIDLTVPAAPEQKARVQAALIAWADMPNEETVGHAQAALDDLRTTLDDT